MHIVSVCVCFIFQREIRETVLFPFRNLHRFVLNEREWKLIQGRREGRPKVDGLKLHILTAAASPSFVLSCFVCAHHKP